MIVEDVAEFLQSLPPNRAICGLDLGTVTIGFAVSDLRRQVATPVLVIRRVKFTEDAARLLALLAERQLAGIVLGLPLNMDGSEGPRVQSTRAFARNLPFGQQGHEAGGVLGEFGAADDQKGGRDLTAQVGHGKADGHGPQIKAADRAVGGQGRQKIGHIGQDHGATPACSAAARRVARSSGLPANAPCAFS